MASQTTCSKPQTSPRLRMASLSNQVAVLDMKLAEVRPLDKAEVEDKEYPSVDIPRWKNNVHIYLPREDDGGKQFIAKVNFRSMGVRYNLHRLLGEKPQLYVVNA